MTRYILPILILFQIGFAEKIVLQEGLDGYRGTEDVTIYSSRKSQNYSLNQYAIKKGKPDDTVLVNTEFAC